MAVAENMLTASLYSISRDPLTDERHYVRFLLGSGLKQTQLGNHSIMGKCGRSNHSRIYVLVMGCEMVPRF